MPQGQYPDMQLSGPETDEATGVRAYAVRGPVGEVHFRVVPEEMPDGSEGWGVDIEGLPDPSIVHGRPWPTPEAARDAALHAAQTMLVLEKMQQDELKRQRP